MWETNSVVHTVMLHYFYTNAFIRIRFLRNKQLEKLKETSAMCSEFVF